MNWLKRLFHREEPEPVEPPKPEPPAVESCPICGCTPKPKHVRVTRNYHYYCLEKKYVAAIGMVGTVSRSV